MTVSYLAVAPLVLAGIAIAAPPLYADSINLFQPTSQAPEELDEDCIALKNPRSSSALLGFVHWNFGQLTWQWDQANEPALIYLLCVEQTAERSSVGGAMQIQLMAASSWSGSTRLGRSADTGSPAYSPDAASPAVDFADSSEISGVHPPGALPGRIDLSGAGEVPFGAPGFAPFPDGDVTITLSSLAVGDDPPITLDPREWAGPDDLAPVPEPGTWLLMGTGLLAAWRSARKRK